MSCEDFGVVNNTWDKIWHNIQNIIYTPKMSNIFDC